MTVTYRPPEMRLSILQGVSLHRELEIAYDRVTGLPFDFTGWTARLDLVDEHEAPVVSFATSGEHGVISLSSVGVTDLDLDHTFTEALPETVEVAGVIHAPIYGQLVYTSPAAVPYQGVRVIAEISRRPEL